MAFQTNITNPNNTKKVWYNGQYVDAKKDNKGWFVVVDGKRVDLSQPIFQNVIDLTYWPEHFAEEEQKYYEKYTAQMKEYQEEENLQRASLKKTQEELNNFYYSHGVSSLYQIKDPYVYEEGQKIKLKMHGIRHTITSLSNRYFSACLDAFNAALSKGKWDSQAAYAEQFQERYA